MDVATTGLNKLSRQLGVKRLGCQDIRTSKHNYSVAKARSFVAVPNNISVREWYAPVSRGYMPLPNGMASLEEGGILDWHVPFHEREAS